MTGVTTDWGSLEQVVWARPDGGETWTLTRRDRIGDAICRELTPGEELALLRCGWGHYDFAPSPAGAHDGRGFALAPYVVGAVILEAVWAVLLARTVGGVAAAQIWQGTSLIAACVTAAVLLVRFGKLRAP